MSLTVVPNPKKEVRCAFNIETVRAALKAIEPHVKPTKLSVSNDTMNYYIYEAPASGIFSMGMFLEISLHEVSPNHTLIQFEGRRVFGWIDTDHEITQTYGFINGCISMLGKIIRGELK